MQRGSFCCMCFGLIFIIGGFIALLALIIGFSTLGSWLVCLVFGIILLAIGFIMVLMAGCCMINDDEKADEPLLNDHEPSKSYPYQGPPPGPYHGAVPLSLGEDDFKKAPMPDDRYNADLKKSPLPDDRYYPDRYNSDPDSNYKMTLALGSIDVHSTRTKESNGRDAVREALAILERSDTIKR